MNPALVFHQEGGNFKMKAANISEEIVEKSVRFESALNSISNSEIWIELAKRLGVQFGKVQMIFHNGRPSKYVSVDMRVNADDGKQPDFIQ
jgi:hypothetical protein